MELIRYVFVRFKTQKPRSAVDLEIGMVRYSFKSWSTSLSFFLRVSEAKNSDEIGLTII